MRQNWLHFSYVDIPPEIYGDLFSDAEEKKRREYTGRSPSSREPLSCKLKKVGPEITLFCYADNPPGQFRRAAPHLLV